MLALVMLLSFIAPVMAQENKTAPGGEEPGSPAEAVETGNRGSRRASGVLCLVYWGIRYR